mmetsp:Transcript_51498/g.130869  ORF Transcript_51498/g.130869 Transcript_51498/m.130869 type:complete len:241 (-) Transcript_51498:416-1138(-)
MPIQWRACRRYCRSRRGRRARRTTLSTPSRKWTRAVSSPPSSCWPPEWTPLGPVSPKETSKRQRTPRPLLHSATQRCTDCCHLCHRRLRSQKRPRPQVCRATRSRAWKRWGWRFLRSRAATRFLQQCRPRSVRSKRRPRRPPSVNPPRRQRRALSLLWRTPRRRRLRRRRRPARARRPRRRRRRRLRRRRRRPRPKAATTRMRRPGQTWRPRRWPSRPSCAQPSSQRNAQAQADRWRGQR